MPTPYQARVLAERDALRESLAKLQVFLSTPALYNLADPAELRLLRLQAPAMELYLSLLEARIALWEGPAL